MKTIASLCALSVIVSSAHAQFLSLPPSSTVDGVDVQNIGANSGSDHWGDPNGLAAYAVSGDGNADRLANQVADSNTGLVWQNTPSAGAVAAQAQLNDTGGEVRAIFVGETAGWQNDFGYTYSGKPATDAFTVFHNIQTVGANPTVTFGQSVDIPLLAGQAATFDFWLNAKGALGADAAANPTGRGGVYTAFDPANGSAGATANQFLWASAPIKVSTFIPATGAYADVDTYLLSAEDWKISAGSDKDYSDLILALQFFSANGMPLGSVPEPTSFGLILGIFAIGASAFWKRSSLQYLL